MNTLYDNVFIIAEKKDTVFSQLLSIIFSFKYVVSTSLWLQFGTSSKVSARTFSYGI